MQWVVLSEFSYDDLDDATWNDTKKEFCFISGKLVFATDINVESPR